MKQRTTKIIALVAMALFAVSTAFAQGTGGSDYANIEPDPNKGSDWELITHNGKKYSYFKGNAKIDGYKTSTKSTLLGFHWMGNRVEDVENDTLYICNVATGEYMQIGDYWGETSMINHAGLAYTLDKQTERTERSTEDNPTRWKDFAQTGYWICPVGVREDRCIGRMNVNDGLFGHFEYNKYLALRHKDEYHDGWYNNSNSGDLGEHPGGFFFEFHPVTGDDGQQEYIIYTHRRTTQGANNIRSEYSDRDSYLLLANVGKMTAEYNQVRFVKFAGDMGSPTTSTLSNSTESTNNLGDYNSASNYQSNTFTTKAASGVAGVKVTIDANIMGGSYVNTSGYGYGIGFKPTDTNSHTITLTAPEGYVITGYSIKAIAYTNNNPYTVTPQDGTAVTVGAPNRASIDVTGLNSATTTLTIQQTAGSTAGNNHLFFPVFNITLMGGQLGDEKNYPNGGVISIEQGLATAAADPNNRWKLVTKTERDRQRLVASEDQPMDATSRIVNPKFYTSFDYNWKASDCTTDTDEHYIYPNDKTAYGWQWYDRDTETQNEDHHHVHPWDINYDAYETATPRKEHHKIGTGHFWRTGAKGVEKDSHEIHITLGQEGNYAASIFKGSANLQQTIKGLREGLYVVYVRGFYAPHDMTKYTIEDWDNNSNDKCDGNAVTSKANDTWYNQARVTIDGTEMWRRSHDSYLFAWSKPDGTTGEEVRRMLPSIYEGAIRKTQLGKISKKNYIQLKKDDNSPVGSDSTFIYTQLGLWYHKHQYTDGRNMDANAINTVNAQMYLVKDENLFARYKPAFFNVGGDADNNWVVPKTVAGAARFFNVVNESLNSTDSHNNASKYRIGLPVYVGSDGELTIGVDHTQVNESFPDEWVCFDDFELLYMGKVEPDEFVIDEIDGTKDVGGFTRINGETGEPFTAEELGGLSTTTPQTKMKNNTQWIDLFDTNDIKNNPTNKVTTVKKVVLRRTMPKDGWSYVVLPVSLTLKHVKEMFGEKANVSKLDRFEGRTIYYKNQLTGKTDNQIVMQAGVPYIVRPSRYPDVTKESGLTYDRPAFTKAYSTSAHGVAGWFLRDENRNYEVERKMAGPIWVATDVTITSSESFPKIDWDPINNDTIGDGSIWTTITPFTSSQEFEIEGKPEQGKYKMVETGVYEPGKYIPANSYYYAAGKMHFTTGPVGPCPRGLYAFMQMIRQEDNTAYAKPFVGGDDYFIEVVNQPTGITDINQPLPDGKMEIYDLQGRKVTNPGRGIYIVNGVKTVFN